MTLRYRPVVLGVLDGWGIAPDAPTNAISRANTPRLREILGRYPNARLDASGRAVGLPDGVMGNSEVGHLTMGAGYIEYQELVRINDAIADGSIFKNDVLRAACAAGARGTLHLLGLLSNGGVHADIAHLNALLDLARAEGVRDIAIHLFLDGRDMAPRSALELLPLVRGRIATVQGRFYAMDRDQRWDRTERAYRTIVDGEGLHVASAEEAVRACYTRAGCGDEQLDPAIVGAGGRVNDGDGVIFFNFRADRARQLTWAMVQDDFTGFVRSRVAKDLTFVTITDYKLGTTSARVAFAQQQITPLAAVLADHGLRQFHAAETEKYAHVTYFFNGGHEEPYPGEERALVSSPKVATYDLAPAMSAAGVAEQIVAAIRTGRYDFVVFNLANPDMVGHTGVLPATLEAMAATDRAVGAIVDAILATGGCLLLTADHGNAEEMAFPNDGPNTQHTTNPVPVVFVARDADRYAIRDGGLSDIAPTLLEIMRVPVPDRMTGRSLLTERAVIADPRGYTERSA